MTTRLHFASDHGAVLLRKQLILAAGELGHEVVSDEGPTEDSDSVDYPDVAASLCAKVLADPGSFGVLLCGSGQGVAIAANKIHGIRAAAVAEPYSAEMSRRHNDANVLCMGGRVVGSGLARTILHAFLSASFEGGRHARRVGKIDALR
ncbi:MAG: ribose 5-phosphate isomerase B [Deltaproteobacteria bacterium]|nr:ribose 5-phosphate isomerase B [Nannocystaceae bacterium]